MLEISHRDFRFERIVEEAVSDLRTLLSIPENYSIFFMQGGGTMQFSTVPLNLFAGDSQDEVAYYIQSGSWSSKAVLEAKKVGKVEVIDAAKISNEELSKLAFPNASYVYYCDNETIHGVEMPSALLNTGDVPVVCDMSSNFLSREFDVSKFGLIFAGAQKNCGTSGVTIVIVRKDLIEPKKGLATCMSYEVFSKSKSLYNTPPTFSIYVAGLTFKWLLAQGGLKAIAERNEKKSILLYSFLDSHNQFYFPLVQERRSRMNVVFRLPNESLQKSFLAEAEAKGFIGIAGHRDVGGCRVSLYNALGVEDVEKLLAFLEQFYLTHLNSTTEEK